MIAVLCGFLLRFLQSLMVASPFILAGLITAAVFRRLIGREATVRMFGGSTKRSLFQAWLIGMLLPICSLGVIPVVRELRQMGLKGGTILAFAMAAPLFNPLSLLYGLTLSEPAAILAFAFCSLLVVTGVGLVWDRLFTETARTEPPPAAIPPGLKRMLSIGVSMLRHAGGATAVYILIGLVGVASLALFLSPTALQRAANGDNPVAPLTMTTVAIPVYATPMLAMSQLGSMFQHANSPGAAFVLLALGAGMNMGLLVWMFRHYGWKRSCAWFALLIVIVLGLAYGVDRPLFPHEVDPADHTHAFDIYCRPFPSDTTGVASQTIDKLFRDTHPYERYATILLISIVLGGIALNLIDRSGRTEAWLERSAPPAGGSQWDVVVPGPVLGGVVLVGLIALSLVGCYAYYPAPQTALDEMKISKTEALAAAIRGDSVQTCYWIDVYDDWTRKLEVGTFLRDWQLSDFHHIKSRILREKLELLKHEVEDEEPEEVRRLVAEISRTHSRLARAFREDR